MFIQSMVTASYTCMNACSTVDYSFSLSACSYSYAHTCMHTYMGCSYMYG